jgi:hypothetical protein
MGVLSRLCSRRNLVLRTSLLVSLSLIVTVPAGAAPDVQALEELGKRVLPPGTTSRQAMARNCWPVADVNNGRLSSAVTPNLFGDLA